jgi:hypothetical protein
LPTSSSFHLHWGAFFSPFYYALFVADATDSYSRHAALKTRRRPKHPVRAFKQVPKAQGLLLPADALPVEHSIEPNKLVIPVAISTVVPTPPPVPQPARWQDYVDSLPAWERTLLAHVVLVDRPALLDAPRAAKALFLASDGGAKDRKGSFGALLADNEHIFLECGGRAYGADPKSFRSEGYGMLAILRLVFHARQFYCTRNRGLRFTLLCDSKSLIERLEASRALTRLALPLLRGRRRNADTVGDHQLGHSRPRTCLRPPRGHR